LGRYFPEVIALLAEVAAPRFVIDGELVIELDGRLAFDALQMRLHPADSRIRKLAATTPARLILFDVLVAPVGTVLIEWPLRERRKTLETFMKKAAVPKKLVLSPCTSDRDKAERWLTAAGSGATDGVIAKRLNDVYAPGERTMIKVKRLRTADCVVGGFRYESKSRQVGSLREDDGKAVRAPLPTLRGLVHQTWARCSKEEHNMTLNPSGRCCDKVIRATYSVG